MTSGPDHAAQVGRRARVVEKYLRVHAEPEARVAERIDRDYARVLVVPAFLEAPSFLSNLRPACRAARGRTLCLVVVNAPEDAQEPARWQTAELATQLRAHLQAPRRLSETPPIWLGDAGEMDVLVIDRTAPAWCLPRRQGVGRARRIGGDLALALWHSGRVGSAQVFFTDADASLPEGYFAMTSEGHPDCPVVSAFVYPFTHDRSSEPALDRATCLYELSLRYYVLGLAWAGSPYAMHTIGSTLAVDHQAYAVVRGVPPRAAGEDFYLLDKLAKVAPVRRLSGEPIRIAARRSSRVPFGTGPQVAKIEGAERAGSGFGLYHPRTFSLLGSWLGLLSWLAEHRDVRRLRWEVEQTELAPLADVLLESASRRALDGALAQAPDRSQLLRRLHTWFDALRTLKLVHAIRDRLLAPLPWADALAQAAFLGDAPRAALRDPLTASAALSEAERRLSACLGPTLPIAKR